MSDALKGSAREYFNANKPFDSYDDFKNKLFAAFLPPNYERKLKMEIRTTKQRHEERFDDFYARLKNSNRLLSSPFSQSELLDIALDNIKPIYRFQLSLLACSVVDIENVTKVCRLVEESVDYGKDFYGNTKPSVPFKPKIAGVGEPCQEPEPEEDDNVHVNTVSSSNSKRYNQGQSMKRKVCYICSSPDHFSPNCPQRSRPSSKCTCNCNTRQALPDSPKSPSLN